MDSTIGEIFKTIIKEKGLTQVKLSEMTDIPQSSISRYTSAVRMSDIKPEHLSAITDALGVSEEWLRNEASVTEFSTKSVMSKVTQDKNFVVSDEDRLKNVKDNGLLGVYQDRAAAFRAFYTIWLNEPHIRIVGSSIEGFRRGIGIDFEELLGPKLKQTGSEKILAQIMLTHAEFAIFREDQEQEERGYIVQQIETTTKLLGRLSKMASSGNKLEWKYFKGAPTCFTIIAGNYMLLNPYLYMQPGYFNFSLIVEKTPSVFDIYSRFERFHFSRAWDNTDLCVEDPGLDAAKAIISDKSKRGRSLRHSAP